MPQFRSHYQTLTNQMQFQVDQFVDSMKQCNQLPRDFILKMSCPSPLKQGLPFDEQDLQDLKDTQWQTRAQAIKNISDDMPQSLSQQAAQLLLDHVAPLHHDHNFNIVITALQIVQRCIQFLTKPSRHIQELQTRLSDTKSAVRSQARQIILLYLTKVPDSELLQSIFLDLHAKSPNFKEEALELATELSSRNKFLVTGNLEHLLRGIAPIIEDNKTKLRAKAIETVGTLAHLNPDIARKAVPDGTLDLIGIGRRFELSHHTELSSASTRSDLTQNTLANRLRNKGESLQQKNEEQSSYVPSSMSAHKQANQRKSEQRTEEIMVFSQQQQQHPQTSMLEVRNTRELVMMSSQEPERAKAVLVRPFKMQKNTEEDLETKATTYSKPFQNNNKKSDKTCIYLEEVLPLENADALCKQLLGELRSDEWSRQFDALNNLRRLTKHHSDTLKKQGVLLPVLQEVVKCIENLRSGVAKNALITLNEMSEQFRRELDAVLEGAMQKLIRKAIDSNQFISEEVKKVTISLFVNCSESRCMLLAPQIYQSKSSCVKVNLACAFGRMLQKRLEPQNYEKLIQFLCTYLCDQSADVRQAAKEGLSEVDKRDLDVLIKKVVPEQDQKRVLTILDRGYEATGIEFRKLGATFDRMGNKTPEARTPELRNRTPNNDTMKGTNLKFTLVKAPPDFELMPTHFTQVESAKDWRQKIESIDWLFQLAKKHSSHLAAHKFASKYTDSIVKAMTDANTKVALHACEGFIALVEPLKNVIQLNATNVWNGVFGAMASNNNQVRQSAEQVFLELGTHLDIQFSVPLISHLIIFGPMRSKIQAINMLSEFVPNFYEERAQLVMKHLVPLAKKLQEEQKPEIRQASQKFFQQLLKTCPDDVAHLKLMK